MTHSLSERRISLLEEEVLSLRADLNNMADHLIELQRHMLDLIGLYDQISSRMSSSSAGTGPGRGDITPTSDGNPSTRNDTSGVTPVAPKSHSRETNE
jgi:hypothetical protein